MVNGIPSHVFRMEKVLIPQEVGAVNKVSRTGNKSTLVLYICSCIDIGVISTDVDILLYIVCISFVVVFYCILYRESCFHNSGIILQQK